MEQRIADRFWATPNVTAVFVPAGQQEESAESRVDSSAVLDLSYNGCAFATDMAMRCNKGDKGTLILGDGGEFLRISGAEVVRTWDGGVALRFPQTPTVRQWCAQARQRGLIEADKSFGAKKELALRDLGSLNTEVRRQKSRRPQFFAMLVASCSGTVLVVATAPSLQFPPLMATILTAVLVGLAIVALGLEVRRLDLLNRAEVFVLLLKQQIEARHFRRNYRGWHNAIASLASCGGIPNCPRDPGCSELAILKLGETGKAPLRPSGTSAVTGHVHLLSFLAVTLLSGYLVFTGGQDDTIRLGVRIFALFCLAAVAIIALYTYRVHFRKGSALYYLHFWSFALDDCPGV